MRCFNCAYAVRCLSAHHTRRLYVNEDVDASMRHQTCSSFWFSHTKHRAKFWPVRPQRGRYVQLSYDFRTSGYMYISWKWDENMESLWNIYDVNCRWSWVNLKRQVSDWKAFQAIHGQCLETSKLKATHHLYKAKWMTSSRLVLLQSHLSVGSITEHDPVHGGVQPSRHECC